jgi:protein-S-isoprenylcysteine O-methyltransferase Ste14
MIQWIIFIAGSAALTAVSWKSFRNRRSHGFYRFFAWECILGLFLLNIALWFKSPLSGHQIISWILLFSSIVPLVLGVRTLRSAGKPDQGQRSDENLYAFEKTTALVTSGIYRYIRHPLYSSLFLLNWGIFFKDPALLKLFIALGCTAFLIATARADEKECIQTFGTNYQEYMKHSKMFVPYIF